MSKMVTLANVLKYATEAQILDQGFRADVIKEIVYGEENRERRAQMLRRHEVYRDKNKKWVMHGIEQEGFKSSTVEQMRNRATNLSIARKIVNKKATTYIGGVERQVGIPTVRDGKTITNPAQVTVDGFVDALNLNTRMKKTDRFRELFRNTLCGVVPIKNTQESTKAGRDLYDLQVKTLAPWEYDVLEDPCDPEKPGVVIISAFPDRIRFMRHEEYTQASTGIRTVNHLLSNYLTDGKDNIIADDPSDKGANRLQLEFIWWSGNYHFTTDIHGNIIRHKSPADYANPIGMLPWVNFAQEQDGNFWAIGGEDIVEGSILINKKLTDTNYIMFVQGWGQLVVAAKGLPKKLEGGPDNAFLFEKVEGDDKVDVFFATSNPPIESWLETTRMTLAMLLSTNNLSVRSIAVKLDAQSAASGVALIIDSADVLTENKDIQELFRDKEPMLWEVLKKWHDLYLIEGWLTEEFKALPAIPDEVLTDMTIKFHEVKPPISEKEKLDELKLRRDIGIATLVDLLKRDNPDLTDEQAQAKATELWDEKKKMASFLADNSKKETKNGLRSGGDVADPGEADGDDENPDDSERASSGGGGDQERGQAQADEDEGERD